MKTFFILLLLTLGLTGTPEVDTESNLLIELIYRYGHEIVAEEMVRLETEGRYTLPNLRIAVENRFPLL